MDLRSSGFASLRCDSRTRQTFGNVKNKTMKKKKAVLEVLTLLMSSGLCTLKFVSPGTWSCPLPSGFILMSSLSVGFSLNRSLKDKRHVYDLQTLTQGPESTGDTCWCD